MKLRADLKFDKYNDGELVAILCENPMREEELIVLDKYGRPESVNTQDLNDSAEVYFTKKLEYLNNQVKICKLALQRIEFNRIQESDEIQLEDKD